MYLIEVTLAYRLGHELPNAIVQSAANYRIGTTTVDDTNPLIFD
jgi:hypothetical protein